MIWYGTHHKEHTNAGEYLPIYISSYFILAFIGYGLTKDKSF
jgi:hypothetical protein